jgi:hypothetical protein
MTSLLIDYLRLLPGIKISTLKPSHDIGKAKAAYIATVFLVLLP